MRPKRTKPPDRARSPHAVQPLAPAHVADQRPFRRQRTLSPGIVDRPTQELTEPAAAAVRMDDHGPRRRSHPHACLIEAREVVGIGADTKIRPRRLWWWRDRRQTRLVREAVARRKHHAERWS